MTRSAMINRQRLSRQAVRHLKYLLSAVCFLQRAENATSRRTNRVVTATERNGAAQEYAVCI